MRVDDVRRVIDDYNRRLALCYASGDVDTLAAAFAEDAWQMPPNHAPLIGRDAIRSFWREATKWGRWEFSLVSQDVAVSEPIAVERGKYTVRFTAGLSSPIKSSEDRGNYLVHWRLEADSQWRIVADAPVSEIAM